MKIKEAFKKICAYNEVAELIGEEPKGIWFACELCAGVHDGATFKTYESFRKYVRKEYFADMAKEILESDGWTLNGDMEITNRGRVSKFNLYID